MTKEEIQRVLDLSLEYYKSEVFGTDKESEKPSRERIDWIYDKMKDSSEIQKDIEIEHNAHEKEVNETLTKIDGEVLSELSKKPMNPDKLKKEIEKMWLEYECYNEDYDKVAEMRWNEFEKVVRHFYELGKKSGSSKIPNDLEEAVEKYAPDFSDDFASKAAVEAMRDAFKAGAKWDREQMMKEAVEIEVWNYSSCTDLRALPLWGIDKFNNLDDGDKVSIIIVKEDEK